MVVGHIVYDGQVLDTFEDRVLAHLQIVIVNKFRSGEEFVFSWRETSAAGDGRGAVWLSPSIGLRFRFSGSRAPEINPTWLAALYDAAESGRGLYVVDEPEPDQGTVLPSAAGGPVSWANDRQAPARRRVARPPSP